MKVLTIVVCAYNMENYLADCLDSFIVPQMDKLEVLIMNDGSKDRTEEIANEYSTKYPDTFKTINKENGGWGSNINMSVDLATGKYFKEVDADDYVDPKVLENLITRLSETDVDLYVTDHVYCYADGHTRENKPDWAEYAGKTLKQSEVKEFYFPLWDACIKTDIVKANHKEIPTNTLYTDNLVVMHAIPFVETMSFDEGVLYHYRLGRDGQSMDENSLFKHYPDLLKVWKETVDYYSDLPGEKKENIHVIAKMEYTYRIFMDYLIRLYSKDKKQMVKSMKEMDEILKRVDFLYKKMWKTKKILLLRTTGYRGASIINHYNNK